MAWIEVASRAGVPAGGMLEVEGGGRALLLFDLAGAVFATSAICQARWRRLHPFAPLASSLKSSIRRSHIGIVSANPRQKSWLLRRSKSPTEMPCCSTQV